jgi:hypothetical protein
MVKIAILNYKGDAKGPRAALCAHWDLAERAFESTIKVPYLHIDVSARAEGGRLTQETSRLPKKINLRNENAHSRRLAEIHQVKPFPEIYFARLLIFNEFGAIGINGHPWPRRRCKLRLGHALWRCFYAWATEIYARSMLPEYPRILLVFQKHSLSPRFLVGSFVAIRTKANEIGGCMLLANSPRNNMCSF